MKTLITVCILCILTFALLVPGCASTTNQQKLVLANEAYVAAVSAINIEASSGKLSKTDLQKIDPYRQAVEAALDTLSTAQQSNNATSWDTALTAFNNAMLAFTNAKAQTEASP